MTYEFINMYTYIIILFPHLLVAAIVLVLLLSFSVVKPSGYTKPTVAPITGSQPTTPTTSYECNCSRE